MSTAIIIIINNNTMKISLHLHPPKANVISKFSIYHKIKIFVASNILSKNELVNQFKIYFNVFRAIVSKCQFETQDWNKCNPTLGKFGKFLELVKF